MSCPESPARTNLRRLLAPTSVAVVGASASPEKAGHQAVLALNRFTGELFPINPGAQEILGRKAFPSLTAVGRPIDLVLFAIPALACVEAVREAIECNCGGGLIVSGGFAESGEAGAAIQSKLEALCAKSSFRLLGPNTAGFVNKEVSLAACFVAGADRIPGGQVAVVAQSAGVNLTVSFLLAKLGYGISTAVGLGNAIDVDAADMLEYLAEQPGTKAIALHLEGVSHGRRLHETLRRVTPKKPVVVLTVGREDVGEFAQSHTGHLIGSYSLRLSALRQAGAVVVESTEELAAAAAVLSLYRLPAKLSSGIGVLTAQAGAGLLMLDQLKSSGVSVPTLTAATVARIARQVPPMTYLKNPVDTGRPGPSFPGVLAALAEDEQVDAVIVYALDEPAALCPGEVLPEATRRIAKPVLFGTMGLPEELVRTTAALREHGIYVAESPEQLARAAIVLARDAAGQARLARAETLAAVLPDADVPHRRDEDTAKQVLDAIGVPTLKRIACASHAEARQALRELTMPVVVKILSQEIAHKADVGGVQLHVTDEATLHQALLRLDAIPLETARRYLVEEMAQPGLEMIVGAVRDASFGPTVMVGLGGALAETLKDTVTRLAPLTILEAQEMLDELRSTPLLDGFRGGPKLDRMALAQTIVSLGTFLCRHPDVSEFELNPVRVYPSGIVALDALLI